MADENKTPETTETVTTEKIDENNELFSQKTDGKVDETDNSENNSEKFIYEGLTKKFKTQEELTDYTKDLETKLLANEMEKNRKTEEENKTTVGDQTSETQQKSVVTDQMADEIFENPKKVLTDLEDKITQKNQAAEQQKKQQGDFWESFYGENKDLSDKKRIVDLVLKEKQAIIEPMTLEKGKEFLANEARNLIKDFGGNTGTTEKLNGSKPTTLGTSQISTPGEEDIEEESNFVNEMQKYQSQRG